MGLIKHRMKENDRMIENEEEKKGRERMKEKIKENPRDQHESKRNYRVW